MIQKFQQFVESKSDYDKLFKKVLKDMGHDDISELSDSEKKKFFNTLDSLWNAEDDEKDPIVK